MLKIRQFLASRSGATAIEYCLIAGSVALAVVAGATTVGIKLGRYFTQLSAAVN